jgi:hypothetical protein
MNKMTKIERTKVLPLRWVGNFFGGLAGDHVVKAVYLDEDGDFSWKYRYHAFLWKYLDKPYQWWGTYYQMEFKK